MIDLVDLEHDWLGDVVDDKGEVGMVQPVLDILLLAGEEIV
jgi:hypothetical protein